MARGHGWLRASSLSGSNTCSCVCMVFDVCHDARMNDFFNDMLRFFARLMMWVVVGALVLWLIWMYFVLTS